MSLHSCFKKANNNKTRFCYLRIKELTKRGKTKIYDAVQQANKEWIDVIINHKEV